MFRSIFKTIMTVLLACAVLFVNSARGEAGYVPASDSSWARRVSTVEEAKTMRDDAWVVLHGHIESHIRSDYYVFRDDTGSITVEIDDDEWHGQTVGPQDRVEIAGEVDIDFGSIKIEVEHLRKIEER